MKYKDIKIGGTNYAIYYLKGTVVGKDKHLETQVSGGGGGGYSNQGTGYSGAVSISSTIITHDTIFLQDENGKEHAIELTNWDIACREGHQMLVQWIIKGNDKSGTYVCVANSTTDTILTKNEKIKDLLRNASIREFKKALPLLSELLMIGVVYLVGTIGFTYLLHGSIGRDPMEVVSMVSIYGLLSVAVYIGYRIFLRNKRNANAKLLENELRAFAKKYQN